MPYTPAFSHHDHARCVSSAMKMAEDVCATKGVKLTPVRRRTLEILLESHRAMGAYDVLSRLREDNLGDKPPIAYRALGFLTEHGFAHRIERLNAYVACSSPGCAHDPAFMICRGCNKVAETSGMSHSLGSAADDAGFEIEDTVIEVEGICANCRDTT